MMKNCEKIDQLQLTYHNGHFAGSCNHLLADAHMFEWFGNGISKSSLKKNVKKREKLEL